jgi:YjbE family integral membrane protein
MEFLNELQTAQFWAGLWQIILINIVLSGDNAVVIALAARSLPARQQKQAVMWGAGAAVVMRIVLTIIAVEMLKWPWLKLIGAVLLLWIAVKLLMPEEGGEGDVNASENLWAAIKTILIADLVMSLDNVIAVAGAAKGDLGLVVFGILISIPIIVWGSQFVLKLMDRFPVVITLGAALLGWIGGDMLLGDVALKSATADLPAWTHKASALAGAAFVVLAGTLLARRAQRVEGATPLREIPSTGGGRP